MALSFQPLLISVKLDRSTKCGLYCCEAIRWFEFRLLVGLLSLLAFSLRARRTRNKPWTFPLISDLIFYTNVATALRDFR